MSGGVVTAAPSAAPAPLFEECQGNVNLCLGLRLGSSFCPVIEIESSTNSTFEANYGAIIKKAEADEASRSDSTSEEDSNSSPPENCKSVSPLLKSCDSEVSDVSEFKNCKSVSPLLKSCDSEISAVSECKTEAGKLPSSQYKGVVPQPNGRWGAQIYEKHQRVWLGTFNEEADAAAVYDRAALKFRGRDAITNFSPLDEAHPESLFLRRHSKAEIVDMLRKHTYQEELEKSIQSDSAKASNSTNPNDPSVTGSKSADSEAASSPREHMFEKTVTPSDVGKLNRLVIPKQHAEKYFPIDVASSQKGLHLNFDDGAAKMWRFRYSYWNSSQSYVLTKGWSRYVKDKLLQAGDVVSFERSTGGAGKLFISFRRRPCNLLLTEAQKPASAGGLHRPTQFVNIFPGYRQWTQVFLAPPPVAIGPGSNPFSAAPNFSAYRPSPMMKSMSDAGNSSQLDFVKLHKEKSHASTSTVMVFGVNLSRSSSSTLNLFPSTPVEQEEGCNNCEGLQPLTKRKAVEPLWFNGHGGEKRCHTVK